MVIRLRSLREQLGREPRKADRDRDNKLRSQNKIPPIDAYESFVPWITSARDLSMQRRFLHWEVAFPGVWDSWEQPNPPGGFDAVIGNPPWDRMKMQETEWFAARVPDVARTERAADRAKLIAGIKRAGGPLAADYERVAWSAETAMEVPASRAYPLLAEGDINLYSLFVERALRLLRPTGIAGLLVPSGISADHSASRFFSAITLRSRLAVLFDFENRPTGPERTQFFPDVYYRFKFCALVCGGSTRTFPQADCAFYQTSVDAAEANAFPLGSARNSSAWLIPTPAQRRSSAPVRIPMSPSASIKQRQFSWIIALVVVRPPMVSATTEHSIWLTILVYSSAAPDLPSPVRIASKDIAGSAAPNAGYHSMKARWSKPMTIAPQVLSLRTTPIRPP